MNPIDYFILLLSSPDKRIISLSGALSFGSVAVGSSTTTIFTITNSGNDDLTVSSICCPSDFSTNYTSGVISPAASVTVTVTFTPSSMSSYSGSISVISDATGGTATIAVSGSGTYDTDALTYFTALTTAGASLADSVKLAYNSFVGSLKSASVWSKIVAMYPFIGGTAATHAINAKTPGTYNITWGGTVTHSANGITGDGSTGYGNTNLSGPVCLTNATGSLSLYTKTDSGGGDWVDVGAWNNSVGFFLEIYRSSYSHNHASRIGGTAFATTTTSGSVGCFISSRISSTSLTLYRNGTGVATSTSSGDIPTLNAFILAENESGSPGFVSPRQLSFCHIGTGLTSTEVTALNSAITTLQTALSRA